jgi:hypothetical protein
MHNERLKEQEISVLSGLVKDSGAKSFLEIGSQFGNSLWKISQALAVSSRVVSVDLIGSTPLQNSVELLNKKGYDAHLIVGNSMDVAIIAQARDLGPYDFLYIDGNHKTMYVKSDFENYGLMAKMVAFHDIAWCRTSGGIPNRIMVPKFWNAIKDSYKHQEIVLDPAQNSYGIGVLWH